MNKPRLQNRIGSATITLPSETTIQIERSFAAPPERVFEAWTTPALIRRWWGSPTNPLTMCEVDLRVGGDWHFAMTGDETEYHWYGTYQKIDAPKLLVSTERMETDPPSEAVNTLTLVELDGATAITIVIQLQDRASRDTHIASGMEVGMNQTLDRLDALISHRADSGTTEVDHESGPAIAANPPTSEANR